MIKSFKTRETMDIYNGEQTKKARKILPSHLWDLARKKLFHINSAIELKDLEKPPGNNLKALKKDRTGQYSIRINDQYRICFSWIAGFAVDVEITDYH